MLQSDPTGHPRKLHGFYMQYLAVGIVSSALPGTLYGFFLGYLGVSSYVYATAAQVVSLPWSFKLFIGMTNDCFPLRGLSRKPYMMIGWTICTLSLVGIACVPMPAQGSQEVGVISALMTLAACGYIIADVAADGLLVEIAKEEEINVYAMFKECVEEEKQWAEYLFKDGSIIGLNDKLLAKYVEWTANRRLKSIGLKAVFDTPISNNPLPWTEHWLSSKGMQVAPQETEVESYLIGSIKQDVKKDTFAGFKL